MNDVVQAEIKACSADSLAGRIAFPEVVARLARVGVERYHADYSRSEVTYYLRDGESLAVAVEHAPAAIGDRFAAADVEAAVRKSQRGEHTYRDFVRDTKAAGCVGYWVQIVGRRAQYFGRGGEIHVELFPPAPVV